MAGYSSRENKPEVVQKLSAKFDTLKFFLKLLWELKEIDNNKISAISAPLTEIGKMIGGWLKIIKTTPLPFGKGERTY